MSVPVKLTLLGAAILVAWVLVGDAVYEGVQARLHTCINKKRDGHNFKGFADYDSALKFRYYYETCRNELGINDKDWPKAIWLKVLSAPGYAMNQLR